MVPCPNITQNFIDDNLNSIGRVLSALDRLNKTRLELSLAGTDVLRVLKEEIEILESLYIVFLFIEDEKQKLKKVLISEILNVGSFHKN